MLKGPSIHKCGTAIQMQLSIRHTFKNKHTPISKYKVHKTFEVYSSILVICVGNEQIKKPLLNSQVPYFVNFLQLHTFENAILIDRL